MIVGVSEYNRTVADSDKDDPGLSFIPILF